MSTANRRPSWMPEPMSPERASAALRAERIALGNWGPPVSAMTPAQFHAHKRSQSLNVVALPPR